MELLTTSTQPTQLNFTRISKFPVIHSLSISIVKPTHRQTDQCNEWLQQTDGILAKATDHKPDTATTALDDSYVIAVFPKCFRQQRPKLTTYINIRKNSCSTITPSSYLELKMKNKWFQCPIRSQKYYRTFIQSSSRQPISTSYTRHSEIAKNL
jgi:hypothetical protein